MITKQIPNEEFLPFVLEEFELAPGKPIIIPLRGRSMRPFLEDGRDRALLCPADEVREGDAVLAEIAPGRYVLHRVISIQGQKVTLRGDGNYHEEYCLLQDIKAKAIGFYRKGRDHYDATTGMKWKVYSWFWTRLFPIRRYLLFLCYPHIPGRFKLKKI